ncbi:polysaccharide biosynthesis protein [Gordonia amarae]|uniref:Polysaccharide biosynthesis protein C-terminal domain-containing protein n=2 Tax=Gordonia amarae TaxID=36821 RepID=G7GIT1_9ACTN|nr:hypothetical protein [Gordonia amarae]MCS3879160.1 O-antigen/teichoic acid export membrane protein [Gordonia amarae]QHN17678.1 polysaccharide biosynthesis protein [Gordonia amarae]QHN22208.1 polysaccharide biosynthesis protein [Gordonia amarae]QHN31085.1 polysaccharide biosynthesis protein [Gordonia amarae]QHN39830.1 polysaccharide biosynthesis protein [Gordonia amarae]
MLKGRLALNASALMISSAATGLLGLVYWMVAERMLPTSEVGRASAMISAATVLSSLACLSLAGAYQRFLPVAGNRSLRLILSGYGLITGTSILLGTAFVTLGFGSSIFTSTTDRVLFVPLVLVLAIYAITDPILIGLRRSPAVAVKNVGLSVVKIVPLFFLSGTATAVAVTGSWMVLAALITVVFMLHAVRLALARRLESADELPGNRELMSFQSAFFTMMLITSVTPFALPLIVVETVGTTQNAYFNLAWTMTSAAGLVRSSVGSAFIVEAVQPGANTANLVRQLRRMLLPLTLLVAAGLAIGGPAVLWVVGDEYFREAAPLMLVLAVQSVVETVVVVFYMVSQIVRRLRLMVLMQIIVMVITVGGSYLLLPRVGLIGVGIASLTAVTVGAAIAIRPLLHALAQLLRNAQNGNADTDGKAHSDVYPPTVDGDFYIPDTQVTDKIPVIRTGAHRVPPSELDTDRFPALP